MGKGWSKSMAFWEKVLSRVDDHVQNGWFEFEFLLTLHVICALVALNISF